MHDSISRDVWGDMYGEVKEATSAEYRRRKKIALDNINSPAPPAQVPEEGGP